MGVVQSQLANLVHMACLGLERNRFYESSPLFSVLGKSPCRVKTVVERMEVRIQGSESEPRVTWTSWTALPVLGQVSCESLIRATCHVRKRAVLSG